MNQEAVILWVYGVDVKRLGNGSSEIEEQKWQQIRQIKERDEEQRNTRMGKQKG